MLATPLQCCGRHLFRHVFAAGAAHAFTASHCANLLHPGTFSCCVFAYNLQSEVGAAPAAGPNTCALVKCAAGGMQGCSKGRSTQVASDRSQGPRRAGRSGIHRYKITVQVQARRAGGALLGCSRCVFCTYRRCVQQAAGLLGTVFLSTGFFLSERITG